jgi:hypothetical protein
MSGGGTLTFSGGTINTGAAALTLTGVALGASSTLTTLTSSGGANGIQFTSVTGGTLTVTGGSLTGNTTAGFNSTTSTAAFSYGGSITNNAANLVNIANSVAGGCGTLTFSGDLNATAGTGINIDKCNAGTIVFSGTTKSISTAANPAVTISNNAGAIVKFTNGGLQLTTTTATAFSATGTSGTVTVETGTNTNTLSTTSGTALNIVSNTVGANGVTFATVSSSAATTAVNLDTFGGGPVTISGGAIAGATTRGLDVNGGSGNITFAASITTSGALATTHSVEITGHSGGTIGISGAITDNAGGINLNGNGGSTINFTGQLTLSTAVNPAFNATSGGGTLTATNANNTITTTTGIGLKVTGTTIGAGNLIFKSINCGTAGSGPANGIVLDTTGNTGGLTVNGTGSAGTGGTIQKTTAAGVSLNSTHNVNLNWMVIQNAADDGIFGVAVNNFTLANSTVSTNGNTNSGTTTDGGVNLRDTTGNVTLTSDTMSGNFVNNVLINTCNGTAYCGGVLSTASITNLSVTGGSYNSAAGGPSFLVQLYGSSSVVTANISGATFANNVTSYPINVVTNDSSVAGNGVGAPATGTFTVTGCTFTNNQGIGPSFANGGGTGSPSMYVRFVSNNLQGTKSHAVNFVSGAAGGGTMKMFIDSNIIGTAGTANSGSQLGTGIQITQQGTCTMTATVTNNTIRQCPLGRGIQFEALGPTATGQNANSYPVNIKLTGNDVNPQDTTGFPLYAIYVSADNQGSPTLVHAEIHGNTVPSSPHACDTQCGASQGMIEMEQALAPSSGTLFNFNGTGADVSSEIANTNTGVSGKACSTNTAMTLTATPVTTVN